MKAVATLLLLLTIPAFPADSCVAIKPFAGAVRGMELWSRNRELWPQRATLRVKFVDGSASQQRRAWYRFQKVDALVNLTLVRVASGDAEIRVAFDPSGGHWSYVGQGCLSVPKNKPTMNLALGSWDWSNEWDRVAIHECLHAIGFQHEHQSPQSTIKWNIPYVLAEYRRTQGWSDAEIYYQVINRADAGDFNGSAFDPKSIMLYPVSKAETMDGFSVGWNRKLSPLDIETLRRIYP